jgi:two-component system, LuxR family, response regulator FixJ
VLSLDRLLARGSAPREHRCERDCCVVKRRHRHLDLLHVDEIPMTYSEWLNPLLEPTGKVYILDDDDLVCHRLASTLNSVGYETIVFTDPNAFLAHVDPTCPGCVLLDVMMPGMNGLQVQQSLDARRCSLPIVFVSAQNEVSVAVAAMKHGAFDFLEKPVRDQELIDVVHRAIKHDVRTRVAQYRQQAQQDRFATLSPREREVLTLLVHGGANKTIAAALGLSSRTVEIHRANIMDKMAARSLAELVRSYVDLHRSSDGMERGSLRGPQ